MGKICIETETIALVILLLAFIATLIIWSASLATFFVPIRNTMDEPAIIRPMLTFVEFFIITIMLLMQIIILTVSSDSKSKE